MINPEAPKRTRLPEAGEAEMLPKPTEGDILYAGLEFTLPTTQVTAIIDQKRGGELDGAIESIGESSGIKSTQLLRLHVEDVLATLPEKERRAAELGFGLLDGKQRSTKEVAQELGVSERTAQRRTSSAIAKLRNPERAQKIRDFLQE